MASRPYVELYIDNQLVEFETTPQVLLTYKQSELTNPTIVKNSFSKTVTIDATPNNNKIFNCFGNNRWVNGAGYNPSKKVGFELYRNGEPVESGYVKLNSVTTNGYKTRYEVTLFGGLGQFLYNLAYSEDGEERKLRDLIYPYSLDMEIDKNTVWSAWQHVNGNAVGDDVFDFINFAPAYNGIPKDFTANKVAINAAMLPDDFKASIDLEIDEYGTINGWILGELQDDLDEWKTKDLRSYLQRPVIRMKEIINACCNPENNGGYEVVLDEDFFNDSNKYWNDAWLTLPLLTEMEQVKSDEEITVTDNGEIITLGGIVDSERFTLSVPYFVTSNADVTVQPNGYGSRLLTGAYTFDKDTPLIAANMAIYTQLVAYSANGNIIGGSAVNSMYSPTTKANDFTYELEFQAPVNEIKGGFYSVSNEGYKYRFFDDIAIGGYTGGTLPYSTLVLENFKYEEGMYFKIITKIATVDNGTVKGYAGKLFWYEGYDAFPVDSELSYSWGEVEGNKVKQGWIIKKETLLNSEHTPADYFLSYIKLFNLHIWKDMYEKKFYVSERSNFYTGEYIDLEDVTDRSEVIINPLSFDAKWYDFQYDMETSGALYKDYNNEYGIPYGIQKIDTNYNFDNTSKNLLEKNAFKGCIMSRGKSRYYIDLFADTYSQTIPMPPYLQDGMQTFLFNSSGDTTQGTYITPKLSTPDNTVTWRTDKNFDITPKPSFVDEKGEPIDGQDVLLFYNGKTEMKDLEGNYLRYFLTDDIVEFEQLNEGEPCWIWTSSPYAENNETIAINVSYLPNFSRYITNENNWIMHSWDFGTPKVLYIPDYNIDDTSNLYTQFWRSYIQDLYSVNTRIVKTKTLLKERVVGDWLRRFYYFDGSYWVLNEITDYDITSNGLTSCTFVRINNPQNYLQ